MTMPLFPENATPTFADYFKLNVEVADVLDAFGYSFEVESCRLPRKDLDPGELEAARRRLEKVLPRLSLTSEVARREFLIAPVLTEVALRTEATIRVEFPLEVSDQLHGTLDYLVRAKHNLLVVEAKNAELERGFIQLAVELVALDRWAEDRSEARLWGAVTVGNVWQIGFLDRAEKKVTQDLNTYSVPTHLEEVVGILVAILGE